jgi:hypothetical protein
MIWPLRKKAVEVITPEPFCSLVYTKDGVKWKYTPATDITAYEIAMIAPTFYNGFYHLDYMTYFEEHNLIRHFVRVEE